MKISSLLICDYCTLKCCHCPYAANHGEDYFPHEDMRGSISAGDVVILTGGEPLESAALGNWVRYLAERRVFFRIATAGYIPLDVWVRRLLLNKYFLGFNVSTDLWSDRVGRNDEWVKSAKDVWLKNWKILHESQGTWLTITVGKGLSIRKANELLKIHQPKTVLINTLDGSSDSVASILHRDYPDTSFISGFSVSS